MAEAAGLAVGAIALVGAFKDCIDLFAYISAARSFARDCEILNTKLDVEKTLLLQWAERINLLRTPWDTRLDEPANYALVERILDSVRKLLSEGGELRKRYGLVPASSDNHPAVEPVISGPRLQRFIKDFKQLKLDDQINSPKLSCTKAMRWAIKDREKFDVLIKDLSYFVSRLNAVFPELGHSNASMTEDDMAALRLAKLRMVFEASSTHESGISQIAAKMIKEHCEQRVIDHLWDRRIDDREQSIDTPHTKTLDWALDPPHENVKWDSLAGFLEFGSGIYWVSGKAGSGKSTLMKHLFKSPKTKDILLRWTAQGSLTLASFFFWNLGTMNQKSQDGLLRALLYRVVCANRSLIPELLQNMWRQASTSDEQVIDPPSLDEMKGAFERLSECHDVSRKFCFFIDGLDEFEGNYIDSIAFIEQLAKSPAIKIILSSRPIPSCVEAFSTKPRLQLQDLTRPDIEKYVHDKIASHPYMNELMDTDQDEASAILKDLVDRSSGVFLWVVLASNSLLEGLASYDRISQLRRRVHALPPQLESLFQHMLSKVEPRYRNEAAKLLSLCHQNQKTSALDLYTMGLALVDYHEMDVRRAPVFQNQTMRQKLQKCRTFEGRLRSRCCGLLEIQRPRAEVCFCDYGEHQGLVDSTVGFIHRSVFEFLESPDVWSLSCLHIEEQMFEANAVLACSSLHMVRLTMDDEVRDRRGNIGRFLGNLLIYCAAADRSKSDALIPVLYKLQEWLVELASRTHRYPPTTSLSQFADPDYSHVGAKLYRVLPLAVEAGMLNFLQLYEGMNNLPLAEVTKPYPLLVHAIARPISCSIVQCSTEDTVNWLIDSGCDPYKPYMSHAGQKRIPWSCWSEYIQEGVHHRYADPIYALSVARTTKRILELGGRVGHGSSLIGNELDDFIRELIDLDPVNGVFGVDRYRQERMLRRKEWKLVSDMGFHLRDLVNERRQNSSRTRKPRRRNCRGLRSPSTERHESKHPPKRLRE